MTYNWRKGGRRGANMISANPQRIGTPKDARWATGRNVKGEAGGGYYKAVEVWACKTRDESGAVWTVADYCDRAQAEAWVNTGVRP
jgi:hypothetical protein